MLFKAFENEKVKNEHLMDNIESSNSAIDQIELLIKRKKTMKVLTSPNLQIDELKTMKKRKADVRGKMNYLKM